MGKLKPISFTPPRGFHPVPGYRGIYASKSGRVFSAICGRILAEGSTQFGHKLVGVYSKRKQRHGEYVHRLVAKTFIPNPSGKRNVYHKNGVNTDNRRGNLVWATTKQINNRVHGK